MNLRRFLFVVAASLSFGATSASAAPTTGSNLVKNGSFQNSTCVNNVICFDGTGQFVDPTTQPWADGRDQVKLADWTLHCINDCGGGGWAFVVDDKIDDVPASPIPWPPTASTPRWGAPYLLTNLSSPSFIAISGPDWVNRPSNNGFTGSPDGGKWVMIDGDFGRSSLKQQITGLDTTKTYELSFQVAGAQQAGFTGDTEQKWIVTYNGTTVDVGPWTNPSRGFTPWRTESFTFQPTSSSFELAFEAWGSIGSGNPPMLMLDGVSIFETVPNPNPGPTPSPAPGPLPLLGAGAAFGWGRRVRRSLKQPLAASEG